jgi:hypothetical protein
MNSTKICFKCRIEKDISLFPFQKIGKEARKGRCRSCENLYHKEYKRKRARGEPTSRVSPYLWSERDKAYLKLCCRCRIPRPLTNFYADNRSGKLRAACKACQGEYIHRRRVHLKKWRQLYYAEHRARLLAYRSAWAKNCSPLSREKMRRSGKRYRLRKQGVPEAICRMI